MAYTPDSIWRNRDQFFQGRDEIEKFLTDKWSKENGYRLRKELFAFKDNKVSRYADLTSLPSLARCHSTTEGPAQLITRLFTDCGSILV